MPPQPRQTSLETVTSRFVIMAVSTLAGIAAFGWVLATYEPSVLDQRRRDAEDVELMQEVNEYRRGAQSAAYELDYSGAIDLQRRVVDLQPYNPENWLALADFQEEAGRSKRARASRVQAAEIQLKLARQQGGSGTAWREAANLLLAVDRRSEARTAYRQAAEAFLSEARREASRSRAWAQGAEILADLGEMNEARRAWAGAAEAAERELDAMFAPRSRADASFWRYAGEYHLRAGNIDEARKVFRDAISALRGAANRPLGAHVPDRSSGWDLLIWSGYHLGWVHERLGERDEAQAAWRQSLRYLESMVSMSEHRGGQEWYNRACLRALTGDEEGAIAALERAVRSKPVSRQHLLADEDLRSLHDDERFHALASLLDDDPLARSWR